MRFLGLTLGEIATLIGLLGGGFSGIMFLFKAIVIAPLKSSIDSLEKSVTIFSRQLEESKADRQILHQRINKMDVRVTILEEHDKWEETHRKGGQHEQ
ncbi:hypothetical protein [Candidatus Enterococcus clewellii]|uniref:Phage shock protein B n=1 Tax=Candidatus Enterococcus clewellii TaxID=1834193 RepID=A0A242K825_9ENTE|nr:hypothetical protein [Enterococcus sp. 9E7_DIV0242]OTP17302.1 hypothetical protein A5888_001440 [Enterococcus sp. 9E7_DIV0242]